MLFALTETIGDTIREKAEYRRAMEEKRRYEDIDFNNIDFVTLDGTEPAYRTETEEEFDPVMTDFLTRQDGWQHYETKTVEYEVEDGENYLFTIRYKDGTEIYRSFHESSWLTERLLEYCKKRNAEISSAIADVVNAANNVATELGTLFNSQSSDKSYENAFSKFKQMQHLYNLHEASSQEDFEKAAEIRMTSLIMANETDFSQSIFELMLYLLSTKADGDILQKIDHTDIMFTQQTENGLDAFSVLPKGENAVNGTLMRFEKTRQTGGYRKIVILTTGRDVSTISNPNIVVWDIKKICAAYISAFKKVVSESEENVAVNKKTEHFAVIDFETTGLNYNFRNPPMDEIISVAIIDQDGNELLNTYCDTVKIKTWYEAQCVHGIAPKDVKGYSCFAEIMPKVIEILSSYDYVISYNVPFEKFFLEGYAHLYTPTDFSIHKVKWGRDPMEMFMNYMGSNKFLKLETAAEHFGYKYSAHNALEDAKAALYVYNALNEVD